MKNVVLEIKNQYAVVLTEAGDFKKVPNKRNLKVGDEFVENVRSFAPRFFRSALSLAAMFIFGFIASFYYLNYTPHGYIDVRINPGVKITLNAMDKVISIDGLNDDGKNLLANIDQNESDPQKVVESIVSKAAEMGFFKEGNPVRITVAIKDPVKTTEMENNLMQTAQNILNNNSVDVPVSAFSIDVQDYRTLESDRKTEPADTTDYSPTWKEKTITPSICDVKFSGGNIIIEFNHNLTLDNVKVYAYPEKDPATKLEAKIVDSKNDKLTVSFASLTPGETYKLEVSGITNKDSAPLDPIIAKIIQPREKVKYAANEQDQNDDDNTVAQNNGNGAINGSNNGNYRNEDGKGNGNANGLDKKDSSETDVISSATVTPNPEQQNGDSNTNGSGKNNKDKNGEKQQGQQQGQGKNQGSINGNSEQDDNEDINENQNESENESVDENESDDKSDKDSTKVAVPEAKIKSIKVAEDKYRITFNMDLSLADVKVTAAPANDQAKTITGQATVVDGRTITVSFTTPLEPGTNYSFLIENASLTDGTKLNAIKGNYHTEKLDTGHNNKNDTGNQDVNDNQKDSGDQEANNNNNHDNKKDD